MPRRVFGYGLALIVVVVGCLAWPYAKLWHKMQGEIDATRTRVLSDLDRHRQAMLVDLRAVQEDDWLLGLPRRTADAGPLLLASMKRTEPALAQYAKAPDAWSDEELRNFVAHDFSTLDLSWMKTLMAFDHWNLAATSPVVGGSPQEALSFVTLTPLADGEALRFVVQVRLAQGLRAGDLASAVAEVRHLVRLCFTTKQSIMMAIGKAILSSEEAMMAAAGDAHLVPGNAGFQPLPTAKRQSLERLLDAYLPLFNRHVPDQDLHQLFLDLPPSLLTCAAVGEGVLYAASIRQVVGNEDGGFAALIDDGVDKLRAPCDLADFQRVWVNRGKSVALEVKSQVAEAELLNLPLPGADLVMGDYLWAVGLRADFSGY